MIRSTDESSITSVNICFNVSHNVIVLDNIVKMPNQVIGMCGVINTLNYTSIRVRLGDNHVITYGSFNHLVIEGHYENR